LSPPILSSEFPSIKGVRNGGGGTSQDPGIIDRIKRPITTMLSIISMLSSLYTTLYFIYFTFIHISFSHSFDFFVLITRCLFKSSQEAAALLLLLLFLPAPGEADDLSTTRISMTISAHYPTITMIVEETIRDPMTSLFGDHPGKHWASGPQKIPSRQQLENVSWQLDCQLGQHNPYILSVRRSILSWRRRMNTSLRCWHPRRYPIQRLTV